MASVMKSYIQNLTQSQFTMDALLTGRKRLVAILDGGALVEVTSKATPEELDNSNDILDLKTRGLIAVVYTRTGAEGTSLGTARPTVIKMDGTPATASAATTAVVGFQLTDEAGNNLALVGRYILAVYSNADCSTLSGAATMNTATAGSIIAGAASNTLRVKTSATGKFTCTMTDATPGTVYLAVSPAPAGPIVDCQDIDTVVFTA